jgi:ABC-type phosphate/phosphonate transport system substrate-binding protein
MPSLTTFNFGLVRADDHASTERRQQVSELCELMTSALGAMFIPHLAPSYRTLATSVDRGEVAFAWMPPLLVLELEERKSALPLALPLRRGSTASFYSAILVRQGGPRSIAELANKRAMWVERESVAGHIAARVHLSLNGFDLRTLASESFARSHTGVVEALLMDRADVGATFCTLDPHTNRIVHGAWTDPDGTSTKPLTVLATAGPIPNDAIVASTRVPPELLQRFSAWLVASEGKRQRELFRKLVRADGFTRVMTSHYGPLRAMLATARAGGLKV